MPDFPVFHKTMLSLFVFLVFFSSTIRDSILVFHCFPVVVTAQFIFFFFIYPVIRNQAIAVTFVTQPFQFNFTTSALSQLTIFRLHSVSSTSFCPIFVCFFPPSLWMRKRRSHIFWVPKSVCGGSLCMLLLSRCVNMKSVGSLDSPGHICKQGWHLSGTNYHAHPIVHLF